MRRQFTYQLRPCAADLFFYGHQHLCTRCGEIHGCDVSNDPQECGMWGPEVTCVDCDHKLIGQGIKSAIEGKLAQLGN